MTTTPGPWIIVRNGLGCDTGVRSEDGAMRIGVDVCGPFSGGHPHASADCRLIAAAPDLLDVARLAIEVLALQRAYFRTRAQSDLIASKQAESRLAKMATAAVSRVDVP